MAQSPSRTSSKSSNASRPTAARSLPLLSRIEFGSFLIYAPRGTSNISRQAKTVTYGLKNDKIEPGTAGLPMSQYAARRLRQELPGSCIAPLFTRDVLLVPAPKSGTLVPNALWPAERICKAIVAEGLAGSMQPLLRRVTAVPKAAYAAGGAYERPSAEKHLETMSVQAVLGVNPEDVLVVDDVVTKGAMLLACVTLVQGAFPNAIVRGFAIVRTMGYLDDVHRIVDPCFGRITWDGYSPHRNP
jgi:hypothetical protein